MAKYQSADEVETPYANYDPVYHPEHYNQGTVECISAIKASMTKEEYIGYLRGNIIKYIWRCRIKNQAEDVKKANWYAGLLIGELNDTGN